MLLLGGGAGKVTVPDVSGQSEQTADAILRRAGLNPVPQLQSSSTVPTGVVISQSPEADKRVDKGSRVNLVVSGGPASAPVTDVEGLSEAEAMKKLRKAGFKPRASKQPSPTVAAGKVIGTNPPAGTFEQLGSGVEVFVSSGPAPVTVPDVTGQPLPAAESALSGAELELGTVTKRAVSDQQPGTVLSQSPAGGSSAKAKSKVNLVVAEAPKESPVPNVVGESEALARSTLGQAGFKVKTTTGQTTEPAAVGIVLRQSPARGRRRRRRDRDGHDRPAQPRNDAHDDDHDHADHAHPAGGGALSWPLLSDPSRPRRPRRRAGPCAWPSSRAAAPPSTTSRWPRPRPCETR